MKRATKTVGEPGIRERIIEATIETVREHGFAGATARGIAATGGFNQALIFYHFGSLTALLLEVFRSTSAVQVARYRAAAADIRSPADLVDIARRLHAEDTESGALAAVTQLLSAAVSDEQVARAMRDDFEQWIEMVREILERVIESHPLGALMQGRAREVAYAVCAMFLGIELIGALDPARSRAEAVFDMMRDLADVLPSAAEHVSPESLKRISIE